MTTSTLIARRSMAALGLVALSTLNLQLSTALAQEIIPPGPPGPTFKTLSQVEPRVAITNTGPVTISARGSYYLATNITASVGTAVWITANDVTLDLNGFTIYSTAASGLGSGILLDGVSRNVAILNGNIVGNAASDNGFLHGIHWSNSPPHNVRVTGVSVIGCGVHGIQLGDDFSSVVERCTVDLVGAEGIRAGVISHSTAKRCGGVAIIGQTASHCYGQSSASFGLYVSNAENCLGQSTSRTGIYAFTAQNCYGVSIAGTGFPFSGTGIEAITAINCRGLGVNGGDGVNARTAENCHGETDYGEGVYAGTAQHCYGVSVSGSGIEAGNAYNSYGQTQTGLYGMYVFQIASGCVGINDTGAGSGLYFGWAGAMCVGRSGNSTSRVLGAGAQGPVCLPFCPP